MNIGGKKTSERVKKNGRNGKQLIKPTCIRSATINQQGPQIGNSNKQIPRMNGVPQSPPPQSRFNSGRQIEPEARQTQPKARPLAGTHPDPAPESTGDDPGPRNRGTPPLRARNSLNRGVLAQKGCEISPNPARLSSRRQLERRRASNWEAFAANPTRLGFMERAVEDFPLLFSILLEREREERRDAEEVLECFSSLSPTHPTRL